MKSQFRRQCKSNDPLMCDVSLNFDFSWSDSAQLTIEFIKFLCVQKGQIPVPCTQLQSLSKLATNELQNTPIQFKTSKERLAAARKTKNHLQFVKKADTFQRSFDELCLSINSGFELKNEQVAIILGTSIFNPRETFILDWSHCPVTQICDATSEGRKDFQKKQANFFRFLVTTEKLYSILQTIKPTKLHVLCYTESSTPVGCLPRLHYQPSSSRGRRVILRIFPKSKIPLNPSLFGEEDGNRDGITVNSSSVDTHASRAVSRRLVFSSPVSSERSFRETSYSLDLSGFGTLEDEIDKISGSMMVCPEHTKDKCWFQMQSSLTGFLDTFKFDI